MFWRFKLKKADDHEPPHKTISSDYHLPQTATELLSTPRRRKLLEHIWQRTSLSRKQFSDLYLRPIERYAELVQQLPASENHHHAYPGGMLDHGLEIVAYALKIRQSHLLPMGATPETQAEQTEAWTATITYAALLHDLGKVAVDVEVHLDDGAVWHPWQGPMNRAYRFKYVKGRPYKLHSAATGLLSLQVLPSSILDWLSTYPDPWSALIYALAGQYEHAGTLGELVSQADQASVAQELGGNPVKALAAPKSSLQRQLIEGLRYLVNEQLKLNQARASDGWLTDDSLWLVSKTVADKLRAHLLSQGADGIPSSNATLFNVLQDNAIIQINVEGKAIWTATVQSGKWTKTLTFLKVSPALLWEEGKRPPVFSGTITVETTTETTGQSSDAPAVDHSSPEQALPWDTEPGWMQDSTQTHFALDEGPLHDEDGQMQVQALGEPPDWFRLLDEDSATDTYRHEVLGPAAAKTSPSPMRQPPAPRESTPPARLPASDVKGKDLGEAFMAWLRHGILKHTIALNDAHAPVHSVAETAFLVTPKIFQRYAQEHPETARIAKEQGTSDWRWVQRSFEKLNLHHKSEGGLNIWCCEIKGPRKARDIKGYLLKDPRLIFTERPYDNPYLKLKDSKGASSCA
ncbi:MobH family relaxase [Pseudomonas sp. MWU13-2105]|uniref:MobH family relaxase n=1 Tax=Pseudomonas sp. MWU13-2105 TaxID=2935074 RepID=UPI00200CEB10|nr:MobH family relaxase [Pseudomonas sp. MWU13-2105]